MLALPGAVLGLVCVSCLSVLSALFALRRRALPPWSYVSRALALLAPPVVCVAFAFACGCELARRGAGGGGRRRRYPPTPTRGVAGGVLPRAHRPRVTTVP